MIPSFVLAAILVPQPVTVSDLCKNSVKYNGRIVRVEGVVEKVRTFATPAGLLSLYSGKLEVEWPGTPSLAKGDRVRVTGLFVDNVGRMRPLTIAAGKVEKLEMNKP